MGPGIITANVDNDAGGITTYSVAGAHFGYSLLWSFIPIIVALAIIQEMCSRMAVVTGKGLADLIREEFGVRVTFYAMAVLIFSNMFNTISEFAGIAASSELFGISKYILVPICAIFVWWLIVKGTYKSVEKVFLLACVFYLSYVISGFLTKPDLKEIASSAIRPNIQFNKAYLFMLMGVIGTTIAPWMQFYQQASVVEKGIKLKNYKYSRLDVIIGAFVVNIVAIFIVIVCADTLFKNGIRIETAKEAALALRPLAGKYCFYLFAFGLLNASVFSACI
jgi:Mn2+/Fe2+ NRAMP family transporter